MRLMLPTMSTAPELVRTSSMPSCSAAGPIMVIAVFIAVPASGPVMPRLLRTPTMADRSSSGTPKPSAAPAAFFRPSVNCCKSSKAYFCWVAASTPDRRAISPALSASLSPNWV